MPLTLLRQSPGSRPRPRRTSCVPALEVYTSSLPRTVSGYSNSSNSVIPLKEHHVARSSLPFTKREGSTCLCVLQVLGPSLRSSFNRHKTASAYFRHPKRFFPIFSLVGTSGTCSVVNVVNVIVVLEGSERPPSNDTGVLHVAPNVLISGRDEEVSLGRDGSWVHDSIGCCTKS